MDDIQVVLEWQRMRNRRCLLLCAGNLLLVLAHFLVLTVMLFFFFSYLFRRQIVHCSFEQLCLFAPLTAIALILFSTVATYFSGHVPSYALSGETLPAGADGWEEGLPGSARGRSDERGGEVVLYLLTGCFYGSGRRVLRAFGILRNLQGADSEFLAAVSMILNDLRRRGEARAWLPVQDYPQLLPHLETLLKREVFWSATGSDGSVRLRLDGQLRQLAELPEPVAAPRALYAR